jgi:endonuclease/exonuclease/phosphatase family metal-dependent hydrolase
MRRFWINLGALAVLLIGAWFLVNQKQINSVDDALRLASKQVRGFGVQLASQQSPVRASLKIASFNIQAFGPEKVNDPAVLDYLVRIVREFDVVAIQELRSDDPATLQRFVDAVNAGGRSYSLVISRPAQQAAERCAFLFDRASVSLDGSHSYTVADPDDVLRREPFVGWFRAASVDAESAFTFSLVNVHLDARQSAREIGYLAQLFRAIRADGRGEDDVIFAGDFNARPDQLQELRTKTGLTCLIANAPTDVRFTQQDDNLLIDPMASMEFTGLGGVFDFLKVFNLTIGQATAISDHLPVWAEFSSIEGSGGRVAARIDPRSNLK